MRDSPEAAPDIDQQTCERRPLGRRRALVRSACRVRALPCAHQPCPRVVILAGDVHYAASYVLDYQRLRRAAGRRRRSLRRSRRRPTSTSRIVKLHLQPDPATSGRTGIPAVVRTIGLAREPRTARIQRRRALGWTRIMLLGSSAATSRPDEPRPLRARLRREPVILPEQGWTTTTRSGRRSGPTRSCRSSMRDPTTSASATWRTPGSRRSSARRRPTPSPTRPASPARARRAVRRRELSARGEPRRAP